MATRRPITAPITLEPTDHPSEVKWRFHESVLCFTTSAAPLT